MPSDLQICVYFSLTVAPLFQRNPSRKSRVIIFSSATWTLRIETPHFPEYFLNQGFQLTCGRFRWRVKGCQSSIDLWVFLFLVWSQNFKKTHVRILLSNLKYLKCNYLEIWTGSLRFDLCFVWSFLSLPIISARCITACKFLWLAQRITSRKRDSSK